MAELPTVTVIEITEALNDKPFGHSAWKVAKGMLNDYMDLLTNVETPYTTGKRVIPTGATMKDLEKASVDEKASTKWRDIFNLILKVAKSGDLTPISKNEGDWNPRLTPVLVLVTGDSRVTMD